MADSQPKIIVVLPTYKEIENLPIMVGDLFALNIPNFHLLIVDDNSPDGTGKMADDFANSDDYRGKIFALHRPEKQGLGPAYKEGFKKAIQMGAEIVIQMDADFSHQPKYIPQLLELASKHDIVIGSRYMDGGSVDPKWGPLRKLLSWWANRIYTPTILGIPIHDATGGFRVYHRHAMIGLDVERVKSSGYVFQVEMIFVAHKLGYNIGELAIHFPDRIRGESKMSSNIALEAAVRVWQIKFRHSGLIKSMRRTDPYTT